jgi:hypothetical protein
VQELDVIRAPCHVSFPILVPAPRAIATSPSTLAVSCWKAFDSGDHAVHLFAADSYLPLRVVGGRGDPRAGCRRADPGWLLRPLGVRVSVDGARVVVAEGGGDRVSVFAVADGAFLGHLVTGLPAVADVEECRAGAGWLVACSSSVRPAVAFVPAAGAAGPTDGCASGGGKGVSGAPGAAASSGRAPTDGAACACGEGAGSVGELEGSPGSGAAWPVPGGEGAGAVAEAHWLPLALGPRLYYPCALALEPGLGLVVREGLNEAFKVCEGRVRGRGEGGRGCGVLWYPPVAMPTVSLRRVCGGGYVLVWSSKCIPSAALLATQVAQGTTFVPLFVGAGECCPPPTLAAVRGCRARPHLESPLHSLLASTHPSRAHPGPLLWPQVFDSPCDRAIAAMSRERVAWLACVARGAHARAARSSSGTAPQ